MTRPGLWGTYADGYWIGAAAPWISLGSHRNNALMNDANVYGRQL